MRRSLVAALIVASPVVFAAVWTVRLEEPTGIYRRTAEVVRVPLARLGGNQSGFRVADALGGEVPVQVTADSLLFPASVIPGHVPEYQITCCATVQGGFPNEIVARRLGLGRVELANSRFRVIVDLTFPAIVEAYNLRAAPQASLNLVEATPEDPEALKADIHSGTKPAPLPPSTIPGENTGWTTLGGSGPVERVEIVESGPLQGRVLLHRAGEVWEFIWTSGSAALRWRASKGFRFAAVSASPFLPFDRFVGGSEYEWPMGPESEEPPDHDIGPRPWRKLPGGHAVYYAADADYGALGFVALDSDLEWTEAGSRRFTAAKTAGSTEIALTFPKWAGSNTVLEARRENRILRQPLLVGITGPLDRPSRPIKAALRIDESRTERIRAPAQFPEFHPPVLDLSGEWELAWGEKGQGPQSEWRSVRVPGSAQTQWLPETDWFTRKAEWVSQKEWWYRKRFEAPAAIRTSPRSRLQFEATDYYADAYLNGRFLGRHEGYVDPYEYEVTRDLRPGGNELLVRVWTPVSYYWRNRPYTIKGSYGAVDQKPDDITPLGITRGVTLMGTALAGIEDLAVDTRLGNDSGTSAHVDLTIELPAVAAGHRLDTVLSPRNFHGDSAYRVRAAARPGANRIRIDVPDPQLWWTWDHGKPNLYTLQVRLIDPSGRTVDARTLPVGIREIEKQGWFFYLNRRRMFVRGTNYYYGHLFLSEMNRAAYSRDLDLMLGMNVNMIRLHCHFANPELYELASERGVLLWQDFLEAWYPHDRDFSRDAARLYRNHLRYARNYPAVALWATCDEEDFDNYRDVTKHLAAQAADLDPQRRPVVRSTGRYGDAHVYHGWYGGSVWEYTRMTEPFVSELGATALPNYDSLVRFLPDHWPIRGHEDDWIFHKLQIPEAMRAWGEPGSLPLQEYIPRTQAYAARLFQLALERSRRLKYAPAGGILHFHAIDFWPSVTMAAVDFYRSKTAVYNAVRDSFSPVLLSLEYEQESYPAGTAVTLPLWLVNDTWQPLSAECRWSVEASGQHGTLPCSAGPDSVVRVGEITIQAPPAPGEFRIGLSVSARPAGSWANFVVLRSIAE